jgi:hypothetical protein
MELSYLGGIPHVVLYDGEVVAVGRQLHLLLPLQVKFF